MNTTRLAMIAAAAWLVAAPATAGQYIYPIRGQDFAQQVTDEAECSTVATRQTGFNPSRAPQASTGAASDTSAVSTVYGAIGGGHASGPAGALGGAPGQTGAAVTAMTGAAGPSLGVVDELIGAPAPDLSGPQPVVPLAQRAPGQADYDSVRAACLTKRGYSVH